MISWWFLLPLLLRQPSLIAGQAFTMDTQPAPLLPYTANAVSIAYDEANHFIYLVGTAQASIDGEQYHGSDDVTLTKHHAMNGSRVWSRLSGGSSADRGHKLIRAPETGDIFLIAGTFSKVIDNQTINSYLDSILFKFAQNGTKLLTRFFGRTDNCESLDGFIDAQNQQLIIGGFYGSSIDTVGIDMKNGSLMRQFLLASLGQYYGLTPIPGSNSDFYGTGCTQSVLDGQANFGLSDIFLFKMNFLNGTRYWTRTWGNITADIGYDVQFDPNSRQVYVGGFTTGEVLNGLSTLGSGYYDAILICTSDNGTYLWTRRFGTSTHDYVKSIAIHPGTGTLFAIGFYGSYYSYVATFSQNGAMLQMTFITGGQELVQDIALSSDAKSAYICSGNVLFTLNISGAPFLASSRATVSTLLTSPTLIPGSAMTTSIKPLLIPTAATIPSLTGILATSVLTSESLSAPQSSSYESTAISTPAVGPLENVPSSPVAVLFKSLNSIVGVIAVAIFVLLVVLIFLCICLKMRSKQRHAARAPVSLSSSADTTTDSQMTATGTYQQTSSTTILRSDFELSLPGYLMYDGRSSFRIKKEVAKGGGGVVSIANVLALGLSAYGSTIIVKTLGSGTPLSELSEREQKSFKQEIAIMHFFREEKRIATLLGWTRDPACILMKFYPLDSLDRWIHGNAYKSKIFQVRFMNDIARGVLAMHSAGFVHCDLKPQNVLVDEDEKGWLYCCLTDFGITQVVDETSLLVKEFAVSRVRGLSVQYAAPEAFQRFREKTPSEFVSAELAMKVDLYSLAVIMVELLERRRPWGE